MINLEVRLIVIEFLIMIDIDGYFTICKILKYNLSQSSSEYKTISKLYQVAIV